MLLYHSTREAIRDAILRDGFRGRECLEEPDVGFLGNYFCDRLDDWTVCGPGVICVDIPDDVLAIREKAYSMEEATGATTWFVESQVATAHIRPLSSKPVVDHRNDPLA